eukprot:scaffold991_cov227-Pinguiococcus_pyrenoidosus.AAC.7
MVYESTSLADFREQLRHPKKLVISYFGAPWCGPCQMYSPQYEALAHATPAGHFIKGAREALFCRAGRKLT